MLRSVAAVTALFVCFQSVAFAGEKHVCRQTGRILDPCACPPKKTFGVEKAGCCRTLSARLPGLPDARLAPAPSIALALAPVAKWSWLEAPRPRVAVAVVAAAGQGPPPRLYLSLHQLLL
jgi:hypothetical protein